MTKLSTSNRPRGLHVNAQALQAGLVLACANAQADDEVAFGDGFELALARAADQADQPPEWVQIFPAGPDIVARDGRRWKLPDPQIIVNAFASNQADLPADFEHATELLAPKGQPAPAQGWVKEIQVRDDKTVWARVDWNAAGAAAIASKAYRYISPAFRHTKDGLIKAVTSIALVTQPALTMPALARREGGQSDDNQEPHMNLTLLALASAAGLAATASEDAVLQAITANAQAAKDIKDPTKFVPAADLAAALARASTAETALTSRDTADKETAAVALVDQAIADGKIPPVSKEHWVSIARDNREVAEKALASMPKVLDTSALAKKPEGEAADANGLTAEQKALCTQLGVDEKAFAANLKKEQA